MEKTAYKVGSWLASGNTAPKCPPVISQLGRVVPCAKTMCVDLWFMQTLFCPLGSLGFCYKLDRRCLCDQSHKITLGPESFMGFLTDKKEPSHMCRCIFCSCCFGKYVLCVTSSCEGEGIRNPARELPQILPMFFPLMIQLYIFIASL